MALLKVNIHKNTYMQQKPTKRGVKCDLHKLLTYIFIYFKQFSISLSSFDQAISDAFWVILL